MKNQAARWMAACGVGALIFATSILSAQQPQARPATPAAGTDTFEMLPVSGSVYLFAGTGANVVVQATEEGVFFVDSGNEVAADRFIAEAKKLSPRPIRYIINTSADPNRVGGNEKVSNAGRNFANAVPNLGGVGFQQANAAGGRGGGMRTQGAQVYAHEAVLNRMSAPTGAQPAVKFELWPTDTFFTEKKALYFNGEPIELLHQPAAYSDGDLIVFFRKSDVVAAGNVYTPDRFPMIDLQRGGSVQGYLAALNHIIDIAVPRFNQMGGTMVVPGYGRIGNESDVVEYRDMATIVRDRIQAMIAKNMTLAQVRAADPVKDYEGIYGRNTTWTTANFVEAVFQDLSKPKAQTRGAAR
jgi:cyclase